MAQSEIHSVSTVTQTNKTTSVVITGERKFRRICAWLLLIFLLQGELGAVWDREWHAFVGRDQFWTPPHTLIYSCVAGAGLLALAVVLLETFWYYRHKPGVDHTSTVPIFGFFHAPLGFSVLGFGALLALIAAPLDNYWHELYGIDIALWAPFHMMGVTGGLIGILGMVYVFASEAAIARQNKENTRRFSGLTALELGIVLALASFLNFVLTGFLQFPLVTIGTVHISTYPIPLIMGGLFCMLAAVRATRKPGVATLLIFFLLLHTLVVEIFVPWAIRTTVSQQGIPYRIPGWIPYFRWDYALLPLLFVISSIIIDVFTYRHYRQQPEAEVKQEAQKIALLGILTAPPAFLLAPLLLLSYTEFAPVILPENGIMVSTVEMALIIVVTVVILLLVGGAGALLGRDFGDIWRWSKR